MSLPKPIKTCLAKMPFLLFILLCFLFVSCDYIRNYRIKNTATDYVKTIEPNADVEVSKVINDTILPFYLNTYLDMQLSSIDLNLKKPNFLSGNKDTNSKEWVEAWGDFCSDVKKYQVDVFSKFEDGKKHIVFLKSRDKTTSDEYCHIVIIDNERENSVEHHYYLGQKFYEDLLHKIIYLKVPIYTYETDKKGKFTRSDFINWLMENKSDIENETDSIWAVIESNFK